MKVEAYFARLLDNSEFHFFSVRGKRTYIFMRITVISMAAMPMFGPITAVVTLVSTFVMANEDIGAKDT